MFEIVMHCDLFDVKTLYETIWGESHRCQIQFIYNKKQKICYHYSNSGNNDYPALQFQKYGQASPLLSGRHVIDSQAG